MESVHGAPWASDIMDSIYCQGGIDGAEEDILLCRAEMGDTDSNARRQDAECCRLVLFRTLHGLTGTAY